MVHMFAIVHENPLLALIESASYDSRPYFFVRIVRSATMATLWRGRNTRNSRRILFLFILTPGFTIASQELSFIFVIDELLYMKGWRFFAFEETWIDVLSRVGKLRSLWHCLFRFSVFFFDFVNYWQFFISIHLWSSVAKHNQNEIHTFILTTFWFVRDMRLWYLCAILD